MNFQDEINKLHAEIAGHQNEISAHSFALKIKQAKAKKLEKQLEKIKQLLDEQLSTSV